jgi:hypothetical protein
MGMSAVAYELIVVVLSVILLSWAGVGSSGSTH